MSARESSAASHRDRILAIFERHRATPGTAFPEERFLNHLMADPKGPEAVRNSFSGLRRFNAFIDEVQLEFGVCFSMKDLEASYSLPRFEARVRELGFPGLVERGNSTGATPQPQAQSYPS